MKSKIFASFFILTLILAFPQVLAQTETTPKVGQKSVQVTIDNEGNVNVIHELSSANSPRMLEFVEGDVSNLQLIDTVGRAIEVEIDKDAESLLIIPDEKVTFVRYDLTDALILKENTWTMDYRYLETTTFIVPEEVKLLFVNDQPVILDKKNGFTCHGCEMVLEYTINQPEILENVNWEDQEFLVGIRTFANIENFEFNQPTKKISFNVNDDNELITVIIPLELLWEPYTVFLNDEKIMFDELLISETHAWINIRPDTAGEIMIIGTTVVPEFPIIAPLVIGFMIILVMPFLRKINLH